MAEQGERIRHGAEALHRARRDQNRRVGRQRAGKRGERKDAEARHENAFGAQSVAQSAGGQDEGGKGDCVGADDPLQLGHATAERAANAVQGGVDDGDDELHDAVAEAHRSERPRLRQSRADARLGHMFHRTSHRMRVAELLVLRRKTAHGHRYPFAFAAVLIWGRPMRRCTAKFRRAPKFRWNQIEGAERFLLYSGSCALLSLNAFADWQSSARSLRAGDAHSNLVARP